MIKTLMLIAALATTIAPTTYGMPRLDTDTVQKADAGSDTAALPTTENYLDTHAKAMFRGQVEVLRAKAEKARGSNITVVIESVTFSEAGTIASATLAEWVKGAVQPRLHVTILAQLQGEEYTPVAVLIGPGKP